MHVKEYFFTVVTYLVPLLTWPAHYAKQREKIGKYDRAPNKS